MPIIIGESSEEYMNTLPADVAEHIRKENEKMKKAMEKMKKLVIGTASGSLVVRRGDQWYRVVLDLPGWQLNRVKL